MFLLLPYEVRTVFQRNPLGNLALIALTVVMFIVSWYDVMPEEAIDPMVLSKDGWIGFFGHMLLHIGWMHLIGNMVLLFIFGNAICGVMHSGAYVALYVTLGLAAAVMHLLVDGDPAVGASGAVCGIMGVYLAIYPLNRVNCFWLFFIRAGTIGIPGWVLILFWFAGDLLGAFGDGGNVAHWAHIGGTLAGFAGGVLLLKTGKVDLFDYDNPTVLDLLPQRVTEG
jgi:membrane associated rhomboid family serine protease